MKVVNFFEISYYFEEKTSPRARDFPNPHDGEMEIDPAEKLYDTRTKRTMGLIKLVDWEFSEIL